MIQVSTQERAACTPALWYSQFTTAQLWTQTRGPINGWTNRENVGYTHNRILHTKIKPENQKCFSLPRLSNRQYFWLSLTGYVNCHKWHSVQNNHLQAKANIWRCGVLSTVMINEVPCHKAFYPGEAPRARKHLPVNSGEMQFFNLK
jgi:hypothetical protein